MGDLSDDSVVILQNLTNDIELGDIDLGTTISIGDDIYSANSSWFDEGFIITGSDLTPNVQIGEEKLDEKTLKKIRLLFDVLSNDERFKDIMADINTQIAFEELGKDNEN